jgi:probable DNA metabolism protein
MDPTACPHPPPAGEPLLVTTFAQWREASRDLLARGVAPGGVRWDACGAGAPSSGAPAAAAATHTTAVQLQQPTPSPHLPRSLLDMLQTAACCRVRDRWAFLYRVVWRWQVGERAVQSVADPDGARLHAMVRAVHREEHAMQANIRFRERPAEAGPPRFVAWYEPKHDVLAQVAQHFVSRMGRISWMIATPEASVLWDGATLHNCGPLMDSAAALDPGGDAPWLAYYRNIFNPQRACTPLLHSHSHSVMRFWPPVPEQARVAQLAGHAGHAGGAGPARAAARTAGAADPGGADDDPSGQQPSSLDQCRRCDLWQYATQAVGGEGPKRARIMLVGEQPGDQEDLAGHPFVGPAGKLLDRVCEAAGVERGTLYVTNAVKHFKWEPRGKRRLHKTPAQREIEACNYWLDKELAQVRPTVIVALGTTALKAVLGASKVTLKDTLGQPLRHEGRWVVTIYHPSYVLRVPDQAARQQAFATMVDGLKLAQQLLTRPDPPPEPHPG